MFTPTDIANKALMAMGEDLIVGDLEDGVHAAQPLLLAYRDSLRALLRGAPWLFARKQTPLQLLADASGQTPGVGNLVPWPWRFEYAYPDDCLHLRFIPWSPACITPPAGNHSLPVSPPMIQSVASYGYNDMRLRPTRYLVSNDPNYPPEPDSQWWTTEGVSPAGRKVILSNVQGAEAVYTSMVLYPNMWDALFLDAMVARLAAETVLTIKRKDPKLALVIQERQIAIAKDKLRTARVADGNETWTSTDHMPDWMQFRNEGNYGRSGMGGGGFGSGSDAIFGGSCSGYSSVGFSNGSSF